MLGKTLQKLWNGVEPPAARYIEYKDRFAWNVDVWDLSYGIIAKPHRPGAAEEQVQTWLISAFDLDLSRYGEGNVLRTFWEEKLIITILGGSTVNHDSTSGIPRPSPCLLYTPCFPDHNPVPT